MPRTARSAQSTIMRCPATPQSSSRLAQEPAAKIHDRLHRQSSKEDTHLSQAGRGTAPRDQAWLERGQTSSSRCTIEGSEVRDVQVRFFPTLGFARQPVLASGDGSPGSERRKMAEHLARRNHCRVLGACELTHQDCCCVQLQPRTFQRCAKRITSTH